MIERRGSSIVLLGALLGACGTLRATDGGPLGDVPFSPVLKFTAETAYAAPGGAIGGRSPHLSIVEPSVFLGQTEERMGTVGFKAGLGFSADPTTFLMTYQADFFIHDLLAVGPLLQFGISDDDFFFAPTLNFQAMFDLPGEGLEGLKPTVQFGLGLIYLEKERRGGTSSQVDFLTNVGIGLEYFFSDQLAVGTNMIFNFVPGEVLDEHFIFCWQVLTFRFQF